MRIVAGERTDTVVEVRPTDPNDRAHVELAEATRIGCSPTSCASSPQAEPDGLKQTADQMLPDAMALMAQLGFESLRELAGR